MRRAAKVDANEPEIVAALRAVGAHVLLLHAEFDFLALWRGQVLMVDVKNRDGRNRLTPSQRALVDDGWPLVICRDVDEALAALGIYTGGGSDR